MVQIRPSETKRKYPGLNDWVEDWRHFSAGAAVLFFLLILSLTVWGWLHWKDDDGAWLVTKALYAVWTVAVPFWFFAEVVWGVNEDAKEDERAKAMARLKVLQDAARPVWAGCAAALAVMLIKAASILH